MTADELELSSVTLSPPLTDLGDLEHEQHEPGCTDRPEDLCDIVSTSIIPTSSSSPLLMETDQTAGAGTVGSSLPLLTDDDIDRILASNTTFPLPEAEDVFDFVLDKECDLEGVEPDDGVDKVKLKGTNLIDNILETKRKMDTVITLADGKLGAHRLVLAVASPFLKRLIFDHDVAQQDDKSTTTLILPDITKRTMELLLILAYTGKVTYTRLEEPALFQAMALLLFGVSFKATVTRETPEEPQPGPSSSSSSTSPTVQSTQDGTESQTLKPESTHGSTRVLADNEMLSGHGRKPGTRRGLTRQPTQCSICPRAFHSEVKLQTHIEKSHRKKMVTTCTTFGEVRTLTFCPQCNKQWKTVDRTQKCLTTHGLVRCWSCFETLEIDEIRSHYLLNHCHESSALDAANTFIRCRWCPSKINIRYNITEMCTHSIGHVPAEYIGKKGAGKISIGKPLENMDLDNPLYESSAPDGTVVMLRYETLKGKDTLELERIADGQRRVKLPQRRYIPRPATARINLDKRAILNKPLPTIKLTRIPSLIESKLFRKDNVPTSSSKDTSSHALVTSTTGSFSPGPDAGADIDTTMISASVSTVEPSLKTKYEKRMWINERDFNPLSSPADPSDYSDTSAETADFVIDDKIKIGHHEVEDDERGEGPGIKIRLSSQRWGEMKMVGDNLREGSSFPELPKEGTLIDGKATVKYVLETLANKKSNGLDLDLGMWHLYLDYDGEDGEDLYTSLKTHVGVIIAPGFSSEIILITLTSENSEELGKIIPLPDVLTDKTSGLIALATGGLSLIKGTAGPILQTGTRGRKRHLSPRNTPVSKRTRSFIRFKRRRLHPLQRFYSDSEDDLETSDDTEEKISEKNVVAGPAIRTPKKSNLVTSPTKPIPIPKVRTPSPKKGGAATMTPRLSPRGQNKVNRPKVQRRFYLRRNQTQPVTKSSK